MACRALLKVTGYFFTMNNCKLHASNGFTISGWMVTELHLQGGDLLAFALVHQFAQSKAGIYKGNTSYLSAWTGWTEKTSRGHLAHLVELGLIREVRGRDNNKPFCHYELAEDFYEKHPSIIEVSPRKNCGVRPVKITASPGKNYREHPVKITDDAGKKLPGEYNSIDNNIDDNKFIPPTPQAVGEYAASLGFRSPEGFGYFYVGHYANTNWMKKNGQPVKNWKNNVREVWMQNNKDKDFSAYIPVNIPVNAKPRNTNFSGL